MNSRYAFAISIPITLIACNGSEAHVDAPFGGVTAPGGSPGRDTSPNVSAADAAELSNDNLDFAFALYPGIAKDETSNVFYSPYSVSLALAMTYAGAAHETASQIASAMRFTLPPERLHPAFDALDLALTSHATNGVSIDIADAVWGDSSLAFQAPFLDTLTFDYGAAPSKSDFIHAPDAARQSINAWVSDKTAQVITDLFPTGSLTSDTRVVLVNALYFHAPWAAPFDVGATKSNLFTRLDGSTVTPLYLHGEVLGRSATGAGYQAVEIPYVGESTSLVIVLPDQGRFTAVESALSGDFMASLFSNLKGSVNEVSMPRFAISKQTFSVTEQLEKLGMSDAFDASKADFSAMLSGAPTGLSISDVLQQADIAVDEAGTTATAATAVTIVAVGEVSGATPIDVSRPFFFVIRDIPTNTALFIGRVMDPTQ